MLEFLLNEYKINVLTFLFQKNGVNGGKFGVKGIGRRFQRFNLFNKFKRLFELQIGTKFYPESEECLAFGVWRFAFGVWGLAFGVWR